MGVLPDWMIRERCENDGMISPFDPGNDKPGVVSYGLTSYGYDARCGFKFDFFTPFNRNGVVSPKRFSREILHSVDLSDGGGPLVMPPHSFCLTYSLERFKIPRDCLCVVLGKSTYARCGVHILVTPLEPEWEGHVTIEIANLSHNPVEVYPGEGIMQCVFLRSAGMTCSRSYADKTGKYMNQGESVVTPFVKE